MASSSLLSSRSSTVTTALGWGGYIGVWVLLGLICSAQVYVFQGGNGTLVDFLIYAVPTWAPWALTTPGILWLGRRFPLGQDTWLRYGPLYLLPGIGATAAHLAFLAFWTLQAGPNPPEAPWRLFTISLLGSPWLFVDLFVFGAIVGGQHAFWFAREARNRKLEASRLEAELQEARFKALKMQLHPHFLFNTINAISTLVLKREVERATEMLDRLSTFLRMALEERDAQTVPLARELAFAEAYLSIERVRFSDRLSTEIVADEDIRSTEVPHLLLQPLVENAVRHGIAPLERPGRLRIEAKRVGRRVRLVVEDDGVGLGDDRPQDPADDEGLGLSMTRDRLQAAYRDDHTLRVEARDETGVRVLVELPIREGSGNGQVQPASRPKPAAADA